MIAVDTSVWVDFFTDRPTPQKRFLVSCIEQEVDEIVLIDVVLTEILRGLRETDVRRVESALAEFDVLRLRTLADFRAAAGLYRAARSQGVVIRGTVDCLIAAVCIREDVPLLHNDKDFERLAELTQLTTVAVS